MKTKDEVINRVMVDLKGRLFPDIENWMRSTINGVWENGYFEGQQYQGVNEAIGYLNDCGWLPEHDKRMTEDAYKRGHKAGYAECIAENDYGPSFECEKESTEEIYRKGYENGIEHLYSAIRRIELYPEDGGMENDEIWEVFDEHFNGWDLYKEFTADEIIARVKQFDDEKAKHEKAPTNAEKFKEVFGHECNGRDLYLPVEWQKELYKEPDNGN